MNVRFDSDTDKNSHHPVVNSKQSKSYLKKEIIVLNQTIANLKQELSMANQKLNLEIANREHAEKALEEMNNALKVLINHRETEKAEDGNQLRHSINSFITPYLEQLEAGHLTGEQTQLLAVIRENIKKITSSFSCRIYSQEYRLTPTELKIADLIRHDKSSKEIASLLNISVSTVAVHRKCIRKKLQLTGNKINLKSYLQSMV